MARIKGPRRVYRHSLEFKLKAVRLTQIEGVLVRDVAQALDVHPFMLSRWRSQARAGRLTARAALKATSRESREMRQLSELRRDYALLREEHELLKKAIRFCSARRPTHSPSSSRSRTGSK
jgi:transposase